MHPAIRKDSVAVVTGAAAGIGYAIAQRLADHGMKLVLLDRDATTLARAASSLRQASPQTEVRTVAGDVRSLDAQDKAFQHASALGDLSILINNAAVLRGAGPWEESARWSEVMDINFQAALAMQQRFIRMVIGEAGSAAVVNVGSKEGITTPPGNAAYAVSKAAVRVLTEQLAHELREAVQDRVSAHLLIPGFTFTPMNFPGMTEDTPKPEAPWTATQVADRMIEGMNTGQFYIFCEDNEVTREMDQRRMRWSMDDLIYDRPALSRWHPDYRERFAAFLEGELPGRIVRDA